MIMEILFCIQQKNRKVLKTWVSGKDIFVSNNGNLVLLKYGVVELWSSASYDKGANKFRFQADGNLVVDSPDGAVWSPNCYNKGGECLYL